MKTLEINEIPAEILSRFNANQIVLRTDENLGDKVLGTTTFDPYAVQEIEGLGKLVEWREREEVYSITITVIALNQSSIEDATSEFEQRSDVIAELNSLLMHYQKVYVAYVVTHANYKPMDELTVFIGGDCYRTEEIKDLETVLSRTKDLAQAMIRKAVMIFPDIPTLHGGKKGEWIILDREGNKIDGVSKDAIVALGTLIIPKGIKFLNDYKEKKAKENGIFESFPERNLIRPDTASPDVLSGPNWQTMCTVWEKRNFDLAYVTCLPKELNGPLVESSYPTGYGVVATATKLIQYYFKDKELKDIRFLLEALGGVGRATVEGLLANGCKPENLIGFDKSEDACKQAIDKYGIKAFTKKSDDFYQSLDSTHQYDVWINNGEGDNTIPRYIESLLSCGVRIFCGAANNFLKLTDEDGRSDDKSLRAKSLEKIFKAGAWAWPDEAASAGGWTLAVIDVLTRSKKKESNAPGVSHQILETIISRNEKLVDEVVGGLTNDGHASGEAIWQRVEQIINERVANTLDKEFPPTKIAEQANVTTWTLT